MTAAGKAALVTGAAFVALTVAVWADALTGLDTRAILAVRQYEAPPFLQLMLAASLAAGMLALPIALVIAGALYWLRQRHDAALYAITCLTGWGANLALKEIVHHRRPLGISPKLTEAGWYSYPSGHTMMAVLIFGLGAFLLTRRADVPVRVAALAAAALATVLVAISRVYLGAHWPSDTVGGVLGGLAWIAGALAIVEHRAAATREPEAYRLANIDR